MECSTRISHGGRTGIREAHVRPVDARSTGVGNSAGDPAITNLGHHWLSDESEKGSNEGNNATTILAHHTSGHCDAPVTVT
jgi:hypothetical protein